MENQGYFHGIIDIPPAPGGYISSRTIQKGCFISDISALRYNKEEKMGTGKVQFLFIRSFGKSRNPFSKGFLAAGGIFF